MTIWGESAGAGSVLNHIIANDGDTPRALNLQSPLFQRALTNSIFLPPQVPYNSPTAESLYDKLVTATGCSNLADSFTCLQALDAATLNTAAVEVARAAPFSVYSWVPVIDGSFVTDRASIRLSRGSGKLNGVSDPD